MGLCRLHKQGIRVLVERPVHRTEFPEFEAFDAENDGMTAALQLKSISHMPCMVFTSSPFHCFSLRHADACNLIASHLLLQMLPRSLET